MLFLFGLWIVPITPFPILAGMALRQGSSLVIIYYKFALLGFLMIYPDLVMDTGVVFSLLFVLFYMTLCVLLLLFISLFSFLVSVCVFCQLTISMSYCVCFWYWCFVHFIIFTCLSSIIFICFSCTCVRCKDVWLLGAHLNAYFGLYPWFSKHFNIWWFSILYEFCVLSYSYMYLYVDILVIIMFILFFVIILPVLVSCML